MDAIILKIMTKIKKEKRTVEFMIRLYCRKKEKNDELCDTCKALIDYAHNRLEQCPFGEQKGTCKHCKIHCYKPEMRERIRMIMKYIGPRMIIYAPLQVLKHFFKK